MASQPADTDNPETLAARPETGLEWAHPLVREWFMGRFSTATEPQLAGWPQIRDGRSTLISAPTGSGKTLAAFLICIDRLIREGLAGTLTARTEVVYVSPLKALGNDIQQNLDGPLSEIVALARQRGYDLGDIRTAVRTGDTLLPARRAMLSHPPHILVTTPESLYILLTADRSRALLRDVRTVIVDEIHAVADDKRGAHLALSLERLERLAARQLTRIGLSATQKPIEDIADLLGGADRPRPTIVQVAPRRQLDLAIEVPSSEIGPVASKELWSEVYDRLAALVGEHRSTLVFVNTRRLAERISHHLAERLGADHVAAHHGSLSRKLRLDAERRLKAGQLRVLVATASLELGIDIGTIDLVCQIGSPRSIAAAIQRIGRAGHWRGAVPKGRLFATTRDELVECAALVRAIRRGDLDRLIVPVAPLDVLAQQIVAMCAAEDWDETELLATVRRASHYRELTDAAFEAVLTMLSDGIAAKRGRYGAYLHRDRVNGRLRARRGARLAAITSGGAIPDTGLYTVVASPDETIVGTVDEDFAVESMSGDVMLLGNTSWRIKRVSISGRVLVEDAHGAAPTIPFWRGEAPGRTFELSHEVSDIRARVHALAQSARPGDATRHDGRADAAIDWLRAECGVSSAGAEQIVEYLVAGRAVLGAIPTHTTLVAERFFDEGGGMQLIVHAPFGARLNRAWGLALRKRFCRSFNFELQAAATDNGICISLGEQHSFPLADVFAFLRTATVRDVLTQAVLDSPIFGTRWRWAASRALALLRFRGGKKIPIHLQRLQSDDLLAAVFPDVAACQENIEGDIQIPDHPLVEEVMKDVLTEAMDVEGLVHVLSSIERGEITCLAVDTPIPSVFSHEILNANPYAFLDDAPLEERRARAVELRRVLPESVLTEVGALDPRAIAEVQDQAWPDVRTADDLHDALLTLVALPRLDDLQDGDALTIRVRRAYGEWSPWLGELQAQRRVLEAKVGNREYWVAAERVETFRSIFPDAILLTTPPEVSQPIPSPADAVRALVQGWLSHTGPATAVALSQVTGVSADHCEEAALHLEAGGWALRGTFTPAHRATVLARAASSSPRTPLTEAHEWCERRLLARIHRLTLGALRREIAPVTAADFVRWLLAWQHLTPGTQTRGEQGTLEVLRQLQGFEAPANVWESQILNRRIAGYASADLDRLCLAGVVGWARLSPHPATLTPVGDRLRRVTPTSTTPIAFFVRDDADYLAVRPDPAGMPDALSVPARDVFAHLQRAGASFFADITKGTGHLQAEVEAGLWELVAAGLVTADGFDNLRALIDPRRRAGHGSARHARPRHSAGRWALLTRHDGDRTRALESTCWMLLRRYGVVFRELLARESNLPSWRDLLITFRRFEDRGEVRGGRFVSGFVGEQFALSIAVESLRAQRQRQTDGGLVRVAAADPMNVVGILVPGDRVPAVAGREVAFRDGAAVEVPAHAAAAISA